MKSHAILLSVPLSLILSGCSTQPIPSSRKTPAQLASAAAPTITREKVEIPSLEEFQNAEFGDAPAMESLMKTFGENNLKDPSSAQYYSKIGPRKGWVAFDNEYNKYPIGGDRGIIYGWIAIFDINAKNSYGGYAGRQEYTVLVKNGTTCEVSAYRSPYGRVAKQAHGYGPTKVADSYDMPLRKSGTP